MSDNAATPKPAATILLLRPGKENLEVFMVVRHHQIDFASGALVFPGGKADPQDFDDALIPYLRGAETDTDMRAAQVSAIREAFEECGILLAREAGSDNIISDERLAALQSAREPMNKGDILLLDFLQNEKLELACDALTHFAHWITPPMMPKRFDTHFYLATPQLTILQCTTATNPLTRYGLTLQTPSRALKTANTRSFFRPCATSKSWQPGRHQRPPLRPQNQPPRYPCCPGPRSEMMANTCAYPLKPATPSAKKKCRNAHPNKHPFNSRRLP